MTVWCADLDETQSHPNLHTLTEVFPSFFLSCKANARVKPAKTGHGPHFSKFLCCSMYFLCCSMYFCVVPCIVCFVSFSVLFVCICVLYYCHRVATQLHLNISYHVPDVVLIQLILLMMGTWLPETCRE